MKKEAGLITYIREPFERFIHMESSASLLLIFFTLVSMVLANSPLSGAMQELLSSPLTLGIGSFVLSKPLILWINDGLMAVFFFVIGLEIKREFLTGELSDPRRAALPVFAAVGGMVVPVSLFFLLNPSGTGREGWAVPMATDIAFSLGILSLLGKRVPYALKVFLSTFAIVDDLGAVVVIALFYSDSIQLTLVLIALAIVILLFVLNRFNLYIKQLYFLAGLAVWILLLKSGVHATIAGVLMAFTIPIRRPLNTGKFLAELRNAASVLKDAGTRGPLLSKTELGAIDSIEVLTEKVQPPSQYLENKLHLWVSFVIMPLFALANAGISFSGIQTGYMGLSLSIAISLVAGKAIGITLFSYLAVKLAWARLPDRTDLRQIFGLALLGGFGFTMAMFISSLAYTDALLIDAAKLGIIGGSLVAGFSGYFFLRYCLQQTDCSDEDSEYTS